MVTLFIAYPLASEMEEHADDERQKPLPLSTGLPQVPPCPLPFSDEAPTPNPLLPPPRREGYLSILLASR
jgi:hypothetical protein